MKYLLPLIVITLLFTFSACSTGPCSSKGYFLNEFEAFVDRIGEMEEDLSDQDWESKDKEFEVYTRQCYPKFKADFTDEEAKLYSKLTLKYKGYKTGGDVMNIIKGGIKGLSNLLNGESENLESNISDFIDQFKKDGDFNRIIEQVKGELDEGGDLRETLEELKSEFEDDGKFKQAMEELKQEFNEGELKETLERLKIELQEAGEDIKEVLEEENK